MKSDLMVEIVEVACLYRIVYRNGCRQDAITLIGRNADDTQSLSSPEAAMRIPGSAREVVPVEQQTAPEGAKEG